jgi:uncharacterized membrane protein YhaH (DUF805 family)
MNKNSYAPPASKVADIPPMNKGPLPRQVYWAVALVWVTLLLGLPALVLSVERTVGDTAMLAGVLVFQLLILALVAYMNVCISRGRNWARFAFLVLTLIGLVVLVLVPNPPEFTLYERVISILSELIDMVVLVLLFTKPGSLWFKAVPRA